MKTIKDVLSIKTGESVDGVQGTIAAVFPQAKGTNGKNWRLQNITLRDSTGEIKLKLVDREEMGLAVKDKLVVINGGKRRDDEYKGRVTPIISLDPSGSIELVTDKPKEIFTDNGEGTDLGPQTAAPIPPKAAPVSQPVKSTTPAPASVPAPAQAHVNGKDTGLVNIAKSYLRVLDAAVWVKAEFEKKHGQKMTDEHFQAMTSTLFIKADRACLL